MQRTIRGLTWRRYCCARSGRRLPFLHLVKTLPFLCGVLIAVVTAVALADDDIGLATGGFYVQSGSDAQQGFFTGNYNVNTLLGADRFYDAGYTGTNAVMANIEAGYVWAGHESLLHVGHIPTSSGAVGEVDRHATWVAMIMGGRQGGANPGPYQQGMAPDAQLFSGAIATSWPSGNPSFPRFTSAFFVNYNGFSTYGPYRNAFITGVAGAGTTRTADVINSSWVGVNDSSGLAGIDNLAGTLDALANENPRTLLVLVAGNTLPSGVGPNRVRSPGSGYNNLTVAALTSNGGAFNIPSVFSNGGPNDYHDPTNGTIAQARQVIDIAVPGEAYSTAYYGGETGGNGPNVFGPPSIPVGGPDWYSRNVSGTSFSAPTVSGGAALLYDAAYAALGATPDARDARVIKAVLKNAADKTLGWNNGQIAHPNGNGGVLTTRGLDDRVGAGRMNLDKAFDQLLSGTTDVSGLASGDLGAVDAIGWDYGEALEGMTNDYLIDKPLIGGSNFTATLDWFRDRGTFGVISFIENSYDNLDLELWRAVGGAASALVAESSSIYNNSEHFSFAIPDTGEYMLRVRWSDELFDLRGDVNSAVYGLAWAGVAVPEPATIAMLALAAAGLLAGGRSRRADVNS